MIRVKLSKAKEQERGEKEWVRGRERRQEHMENMHVFLTIHSKILSLDYYWDYSSKER